MKSLFALKVLDLVSEEDRPSVRKMAEDSRVPYEWLKSFRYGRIAPERANVAYLEALYAYLTGKPLSL